MKNDGKKNGIQRAFEGGMSALKRGIRWMRRAFFGSRTEYANVEKIESPSALLRGNFLRKKSAVVASVVFLTLFLFVFIAPSFVPLDVNYTDPLQQNVAPIYSLRRVPRSLRSNVKDINGFSDFTVGLSSTGEVFVWGNTRNRLNGLDVSAVPDTVRETGAAFVSAGKDHVLALTGGGKLVGWGDNSCGQYGTAPVLNALPMPMELLERIEPGSVQGLSCGYQASALVLKNGRAYLWGNLNAVGNLSILNEALKGAMTKKIVFTNSAAVALTMDGKVEAGVEPFHGAVSSKVGKISSFNAYMVGRNALDIAADNKCIAVLLEDGELLVAGAFENGEDVLPTLQNGERFVSLNAGTRHFIGVTDKGKVYAWGGNAYGQCEVKRGDGISQAFAGSLQSYTIDGKGALQESVGLKGYIMGTDGRGRDVFARIVHGGKMTLTIGAVAVIVSTVIAIVVGCISGYFGGWVDLLLMRITEIFSSIPFLPFAMLLSQIIKNYNVSETMRIFIIMLILGALSWTGLARMIRGQVLAEREKEFVLAARAMGVKESKIAFKHVLPNVVSVLLVSMTLDFAGCLLTESSLSYLGFGVQPPKPTWGNMLSGSNNSTIIQHYWWQWLFPALFLSLAVICINVIGDALRDALDPKGEKN